VAGFAAVQFVGNHGRTGIGLLFAVFFFLGLLNGLGYIVLRLLGRNAALEFPGQAFGIFVELVGIGVAVIFEDGAPVHRDVSDGLSGAGCDEIVQLAADFLFERGFFAELFYLLLFGKVQYEGVLLLEGGANLRGQQGDDHHEMENHGDV
jgi:hypothetical protein